MSTLGIDIAWSRPSPGAIYAAGYRFVVGYLSHDPTKNLTRPYIDALHAAHLYAGLNWESTATRAGQGSAAGTEDGTAAGQQLVALGAPRSMVVPFAVDHDYAPSQVEPYARAFQAALARYGYRAGVYGSLRVESACRSWGLATREWQTVAWSGGKVDGSADLYQRSTHSRSIAGVANGAWDEDVLLSDESWFWAPSGAPTTKAPTHVTTVNATPVHPATPAPKRPAPTAPTVQEDDVLEYLIGKNKEYPTGAVFAYGPEGVRRISPQENAAVVKPLVAAKRAEYRSVPDGTLDTIRLVA